MAMSWKIRAVTTEDAESGTGYWEPFAVGHGLMGEEVILLRQFAEWEEENEKSSTRIEGHSERVT